MPLGYAPIVLVCVDSDVDIRVAGAVELLIIACAANESHWLPYGDGYIKGMDMHV